MKRKLGLVLSLALIAGVFMPSLAHARPGDCGFEGGISSRQASYGNQKKISLDYAEVCFITGKPIIFKGTLTIDKSMKKDAVSAKYQYNLENADKTATIQRSLEYSTSLATKENGQTIETTVFSKKPAETIQIGDTTYTLEIYDFTRTSIVDSKPAINYHAGNSWGRKVYSTGNGTVTLEITGDFYGYDQYWGSTEAGVFNYVIRSETGNGEDIDRWGGTARVSVSSTMTRQMKFVENQPEQISFDGGYVEVQHDNSIAEYTCRLPEFDSDGVSTDNIIVKRGSLKNESFPSQSRLPVPNIRHLRGHWAENDIKTLFSLEVFTGNDALFLPEQYMSRAEFVTAMVQAAKEVPVDAALQSRTTVRTSRARRSTGTAVESPFRDVPSDSIYFPQIENAYKRGLIAGRGNDYFVPNGKLTVAEAITVFIRSLGLESLAPAPHAVTTFRDNDDIPDYARDAVYVAERIGLIQGDMKGYLRPNEYLTKARAAALINRFINYMRDGIRADYRERIVNYN